MKIVANAGLLMDALALALRLHAGKNPPAALEAVNVIAGNDNATIVRNVLENQISLTVPATVERPGALALPSGRLAALAAGFPAAAEITIESDGAAAKVRGGRSHYRLPVVPPGDVPAPLAVADATSIALSCADALALFAAGFCAAHDARTYLRGLHITDSADGLIGVSTDGYALCRRALPGITGYGRSIIVPTAAVRVIGRLLAGKGIEHVTLQHSATLIAVETPAATFISRLIDGAFPDYARVIPKPSTNIATIDRGALLQALARLAAAGDRTAPQITWTARGPALHLASGDDTDTIDAETTGSGKVALAIDRLAALLDEFTGKTVTIDVADAATPVRFTDPDDAGFLAILAPRAS
jgi:DNA polymerase III subunit beta